MDIKRLKKVYLSFFAVVVAFLISFYFLADDQLKYRDSRFNIVSSEGVKTTKELVFGRSVSQYFINNVDRLKSVSFQITTYYRENNGKLYAELYHNDERIMSGTFDLADLTDRQYVTISSDEFLEGLTGQELMLKIKSSAEEGNGIGVLYSPGNSKGTKFYDQYDYTVGGMSFNTYGEEFIFTGQYYWHMAVSFSLLVALILIFSYQRTKKGKVDYISTGVFAVKKYEFLISQLVSRDFKIKYKRSVLGVLWSFLNPLLTMTVQYIVFSTMFRTEIENYAVYLLIGIICYSFFNEVTTMSLQSITGNANLIKKVYMPKYILPLSRTLSSTVNLLISLIPLILISLLTGVVFKKAVLLSVFFLACLIVFALGIGLFLSALNVFFRDVQFLWTVVCMMWMYATPIFYSPSIIPERFSFILNVNPLYHFIKNIRMCVIDGLSPGPRSYIFCFVFAIGSLLIGSLVFKKSQDKFTLYL